MTPNDADRIMRNPQLFGQTDLDEATHTRIANMRAEQDNRGPEMLKSLLIAGALIILAVVALMIAGLGIEKAAADAVQAEELAVIRAGGW